MRNNLKKQTQNYNSDIELTGNGNLDYGHVLAERLLRESKQQQGNLEKRIDLEKDIKFIKAIKNSGTNIEDYFSDREVKQKILIKNKDYSGLKGKNGRFLSWTDCSDYQVGSALANDYYSALNKIKKYMERN
ncbi:MAG: hypothetical protein Q8O84_01430 [Nanoarchaeota archaeon]|nr:hypothetical protein [Nanoarchaeota archaeon]